MASAHRLSASPQMKTNGGKKSGREKKSGIVYEIVVSQIVEGWMQT
jgi:hypothetical protein